MLPALAEWKDELDEVRRKLDVATVPVQSSYIRSQALIERLKTCEDEERVALRLELRQSIKFVLSRIDIEVTGEKFKAKTVDITVTLRDGNKRTLYYRTDGTRLSECGVSLPKGGNVFEMLNVFTETTKVASFVPDPVPFRRRGKFAGRPVLNMTVDEVKAKVREMSAAGMSGRRSRSNSA